MYLRELRIQGFKSFADQTRLEFGPGVTAIVGPNGCGKSNTADAIRWVLGEQSAKSLRAGAMADVIFQGTDARKQLNLCEVTLVFTDCEAALGVAYNEVEITRRVTRDGGSVYYLNGKTCRLRDIHNLFLDTGIGQTSYSFMMQGQIDQILSSNPTERRTIFEEAAGISRYKAQRKEALNKLKLTEANMERVTDVINEISRQRDSLKRQAAKAMRYQIIKRRLTALDLARGGHRYAQLSGKVTGGERQAEMLREQVAAHTEKVDERESRLAVLKGERADLAESLQSAQRAVYDLRSEKENAEGQAELAEARIADARSRIAEVEREVERIAGQVTDLDSRQRDEAADKERQQQLYAESDQAFSEKNAALEEASRALSAAERALHENRQKTLIVESNLTRLRGNATSLEVDLRSFQEKLAAQESQISQLKDDEGVHAERLHEYEAVLEKRTADKAKAAEVIEGLQAEIKETTGAFREAQGNISEADRAVAQVIAQIGVMESMQHRLEGFGEGAKAVLQGKLGDEVDTSGLKLIAKSLKVKEVDRRALEAILGPATDAIAAPEAATARAISATMTSRRLGRACLHLAVDSEAEPTDTRAIAAQVGGFVAAGDVVSASEAALAPHVSALLAGTYICDDLDAFLAAWQGAPTAFRFRAVADRSGSLCTESGLIFAGREKKEQTSFLQRQNELAQLATKQSEGEQVLDALRADATKLQDKLNALNEQLEDRRHELSEINGEISSLNGQIRGETQSREQATRRLQQANTRLTEIRESRETSQQRLDRAKHDMVEGEKRLTEVRDAITEAEKAVEASRGQRDERREHIASFRLDMAEKRQRLEIIDRGLAEVQRLRKELSDRDLRHRQEIDTLREQIADYEHAIETSREKAAEIERTLSQTMGNLETQKARHKETEAKIEGIEKDLNHLRTSLTDGSSKLSRVEVELARDQSQLQQVIDEIEREYDRDIGTVDWRREIWSAGDPLPERIRVEVDDEEDGDSTEAEADASPSRAPDEPTDDDLAAADATDWPAVEREIKDLRNRINAMGPVNTDAITEYTELKERYDFYKSQSDDIWATKEELVNAINEINETSTVLFRETFEQVRKNFAHTFVTLFGGGESNLELIDTEDPLESGIEIIARPPGTRLRSLQLLSGGQKTMTAVALLFAIYMVKPSPFCMLDELDAPLDDSNVGRFTDIVKQFTTESQFLIITHNKRTIAAADTIYGVTMQEKGVSKVLSMRFDQAARETEKSA